MGKTGILISRNIKFKIFPLINASLSDFTCCLNDTASSSFVIAGKPVSYLLLDDLAEGLDTNWIELGKILGFSRKRLQKIDMKNERLRDKGMAMLVGWKMRRGDDATVEVLQNALVELGMMGMLELDAGTNYYDTKLEFARIISSYHYLTSIFLDETEPKSKYCGRAKTIRKRQQRSFFS